MFEGFPLRSSNLGVVILQIINICNFMHARAVQVGANFTEEDNKFFLEQKLKLNKAVWSICSTESLNANEKAQIFADLLRNQLNDHTAQLLVDAMLEVSVFFGRAQKITESKGYVPPTVDPKNIH